MVKKSMCSPKIDRKNAVNDVKCDHFRHDHFRRSQLKYPFLPSLSQGFTGSLSTTYQTLILFSISSSFVQVPRKCSVIEYLRLLYDYVYESQQTTLKYSLISCSFASALLVVTLNSSYSNVLHFSIAPKSLFPDTINQQFIYISYSYIPNLNSPHFMIILTTQKLHRICLATVQIRPYN